MTSCEHSGRYDFTVNLQKEPAAESGDGAGVEPDAFLDSSSTNTLLGNLLTPIVSNTDLDVSRYINDMDLFPDLVTEQDEPESPGILLSGGPTLVDHENNQFIAPGITKFGATSVVSDRLIDQPDKPNGAASSIISTDDEPSFVVDGEGYEQSDNLVINFTDPDSGVHSGGCNQGIGEKTPDFVAAAVDLELQPTAPRRAAKHGGEAAEQECGKSATGVDEPMSNMAFPHCSFVLQHEQTYDFTALPSPQRNHIRINQVSFLGACLANLNMLGVSSQAASYDDCTSPFFQPGLSAGRSARPSSANKSVFRHLKPDLQPRPAQIFFNHHPYIDVIPFPVFREQVITLLSLATPCFDEDELCMDLLNDGLICWGNNSDGGSGAPWDARSWEVTPWFMKKWWMILGGKSGAIYQQTQWWREIRGIGTEITW